MAMVSNPKAASSDAISEGTQQNRDDVQIEMENPDTILFSKQSTLKRTKENEIIQISSDKLTGEIVGKEGNENATEALKGKNMKYFSKETGKILFVRFWKFSFLFKSTRFTIYYINTLVIKASPFYILKQMPHVSNCFRFSKVLNYRIYSQST